MNAARCEINPAASADSPPNPARAVMKVWDFPPTDISPLISIMRPSFGRNPAASIWKVGISVPSSAVSETIWHSLPGIKVAVEAGVCVGLGVVVGVNVAVAVGMEVGVGVGVANRPGATPQADHPNIVAVRTTQMKRMWLCMARLLPPAQSLRPFISPSWPYSFLLPTVTILPHVQTSTTSPLRHPQPV